MNLIQHIHRQREWALRTFGPNWSAQNNIEHIRKELDEVAADPSELSEWVDVILLAIQGAFRSGHTPAEIAYGVQFKQRVNESRDWPDWRMVDHSKPIEHVREGDEEPAQAVGGCHHHRLTLRCMICNPDIRKPIAYSDGQATERPAKRGNAITRDALGQRSGARPAGACYCNLSDDDCRAAGHYGAAPLRPAKRWLVDPPRGSNRATREFHMRERAEAYLATCPRGTRLVDRHNAI